MRVLVVGGAGYIGSVVTRMLRQQGFDAVVFDNLSKGHRRAVPADCLFIEGDMGDASHLRRVFSERFDAVMHFAAFSAVGESVQDPAPYFENNFAKSLVLFKAMREHGVNKLIFSSTASVYGDPDLCPITEDFPLKPTSPYGESKLAVENALKWYSQAYDLHYASLRYFNAAGAYEDAGEDHEPESHLIPLILKVAEGSRASLTIFGDDYLTVDGTCIRDYIHVKDLAEAHRLALMYLHNGGSSDVFNLGNGDGASVRQVITAAEKVTGKAISIEKGQRRPGDPAVLVASSAKINRILGWQAKNSSLEQMIKDAWQWRCKHAPRASATERP